MEKYVTARKTTNDKTYGACALHAGYLRLQIITIMLYNKYCFSMA